MEGYIDLLINGFLNIYSYDTSTNGEVLGFMIAILCIFLTLNFLPVALSWAIFSNDESQIIEEKFKTRWGALFEFIKTKNKMARLYNLIFVLRRLIFVMLCFFKNQSGGLLLAINIFINFIYSVYMASTKAFILKNMNIQDFFNECIISASIYWKLLYTNMIESQEDQYNYAKMEMSFILFYCFVNLIVIIHATIQNNKKYVIYIYNLATLKFNKLFPKID